MYIKNKQQEHSILIENKENDFLFFSWKKTIQKHENEINSEK